MIPSKDLSLYRHVQNGSGTHPFYPVCIWMLFTRNKGDQAIKLIAYVCMSEVKNAWYFTSMSVLCHKGRCSISLCVSQAVVVKTLLTN
jgi:hypothetical protein